MKLQEGIKLVSLEDLDRVFINCGVELAGDRFDKGSIKYTESAYIPQNNWRLLTGEERDLLISSESVPFSRSVLFGRVSEDIVELLSKLNLRGLDNYRSVLQAFADNPIVVNEIQKRIIFLLAAYAEELSNVMFHKIVFNPPRILTLTYYITDEHLNFVGLHIDRSTVFSFDSVEKSANRFCLNITEEPRIVYLVNLSLNQIRDLIFSHKDYNFTEVTIDNAGKLFFELYPDYPVIKVIQKPFEYYIMPTDNVLHDGSTISRETHDINLVYLGEFNTHIKK